MGGPWGYYLKKKSGVPPKKDSLIFLGNISGHLKIQLLLPNVHVNTLDNSDFCEKKNISVKYSKYEDIMGIIKIYQFL